METSGLYSIISGIAVLGMLLSIGAHACMGAHGADRSDTRIFGKIPLVFVGVVGYGLIAATAVLYNMGAGMVVANHALVLLAALFTVYLVRKAIRIRIMCSVCLLIWTCNAALAFLVAMAHLYL